MKTCFSRRVSQFHGVLTTAIMLTATTGVAMGVTGCSTSTNHAADNACSTNASCNAGFICDAGTCIPLCSADNDCSTGQICNNATSRCETCSNCRITPEIAGINGTGSMDHVAGHAANHIADSLLLTGNHFLGGQVQLTGGNFDRTVLAVRGDVTNTSVEVILPQSISPGTYTLSIINQAGRDTTNATVLQGEQGIPGVYQAGDGIDVNGDTIGVVFGTTAGTVARGDHAHAIYALQTDLEAANSANTTNTSSIVTLSATTTAAVTNITRPCTTSGNTAGIQTYDANNNAWGTCGPSTWNCNANSTHAGCANGPLNTRSTYLSCKNILNSGYSGSSGVFWIDSDGNGSTAPYQAYCDMVSDGGGWTLALNLDTSDSGSRYYDDTTFWQTATTVNNLSGDATLADNPLDNDNGNGANAVDFKSVAFSTLGLNEIMLVAHEQGGIRGTASYDLLANTQGNTLQSFFNSGSTNLTLTAPRRSVTGSLTDKRPGAAGDIFIDQAGPIIINFNKMANALINAPYGITGTAANYARLGADYSSGLFAQTAQPSDTPYFAGGWGGVHASGEGRWSGKYEGSAFFRYNISTGGGGYGTNLANGSYIYWNIFTDGSASTQRPNIDLAVFIR